MFLVPMTIGCPAMYTFPGTFLLSAFPYPQSTVLFLPMPSSLCLLVTLIYLWSESDMHSASLISIENDTV